MRYWKSLEDFKSRRRHPRGDIELMEPWAHVAIINTDEPDEMGKWLFQLETPNKIIQLRVDTYRELVEWSNALHRPPPSDALLFDVLQTEIHQTEQNRAQEFGNWIDELSKFDAYLTHGQANEAFLRFLRNR